MERLDIVITNINFVEGNTRIRERDSDRNSTIYSQISHHRKIPSLIDTLREGRIFEPPKSEIFSLFRIY